MPGLEGPGDSAANEEAGPWGGTCVGGDVHGGQWRAPAWIPVG